jgi:hypothetical protein
MNGKTVIMIARIRPIVPIIPHKSGYNSPGSLVNDSIIFLVCGVET